ncbi:uncharacterized protein LOC128963562 [Oppia nitens]|uniref:uncharacterized protein LOC128963562 n=1 Tax=Oppia nitens TaxID=1686743 RepID=UPI0023D987CA|nr:uncharacterized protein LOC128963562 [Oppia nitens]
MAEMLDKFAEKWIEINFPNFWFAFRFDNKCLDKEMSCLEFLQDLRQKQLLALEIRTEKRLFCRSTIKCRINGKELKAVLDSGSDCSFLDVFVAKSVGICHLVDTRFKTRVFGLNGKTTFVGRIHCLDLCFGQHSLNFPFSVTNGFGLAVVVLGTDFLTHFGANLDFVAKTKKFP